MHKIKKKLHIIGAGGHSKVVIDNSNIKKQFGKVYIYDDRYPMVKTIHTFKVFNTVKNIEFNKDDYYFVAIGDNKIRKKFINFLIKKKLKLATIAHKTSVISVYSKILPGTYIGPKAIINSNALINVGCIINTAAVVEHDCVIGDYCHIAPNSVLGGGVEIGSNTLVGIGSVIVPNIKIKKNSFIKAGEIIKK